MSAAARAGDLGPFVDSAVSLPQPTLMFAAAGVGDQVFVISGCTSGNNTGICSTWTTDVLTAFALPDGGLSAFSPTTPLPEPRSEHMAALVNGALLVVGGDLPDGGVAAGGLAADVLADGGLSAWRFVALPAALDAKRVVIQVNGTAFFGGGAYFTNMYACPAGLATGTNPPWQATSPLLAARGWTRQASPYGDELCRYGGFDTVERADVTCAPVNANGTLGTWRAVTPLPEIRSVHALVFGNDEVHLVGGNSPTIGGNRVLTASLDGGVPGTWRLGAFNLNHSRIRHEAVVAGGRVWVMGGVFSDVPLSSIESALVSLRAVPSDAGVLDAGVLDAGLADAGLADAGTPEDAGTTDAGGPLMPAQVKDYPVGCGCTSAAAPLLTLLCLGLRRRPGRLRSPLRCPGSSS